MFESDGSVRRLPSGRCPCSELYYVLAGVLIGYSANHLLSAVSMIPPWKSADSPPDPVVTDGKIPALEVGKSMVLMDEKHSADPGWASSGTFVRTCDTEGELGVKLSSECLGTYLARHALGRDMDRGPKDAWIALDEVAEICDAGQIEKDWPVCADAYARASREDEIDFANNASVITRSG